MERIFPLKYAISSFGKCLNTVEIVYNEHEDQAEIARYNRL